MLTEDGSRPLWRGRTKPALLMAATLLSSAAVATSASASQTITRTFLPSIKATAKEPLRFATVGVIKVGSPAAKNVLVLEPGTSAGAGYFVQLAKWLVQKAPTWQVWSVERRENLLEDQSRLRKLKKGTVTPEEFFNYYLGWLANGTITTHVHEVEEIKVPFARQWGMNVAVEDLHVVINAAKELGGKVVLGGHSLGGSVVTAYATWDFAGKPGAEGLSGLVYDDGGSSPIPVSVKEAEESISKLAMKTPWLAFGGIPAPLLGLFGMVGATLSHVAPNERSLFENWPFLPPSLRPKNEKGENVPSTNEAGFAYGVNVGTSPPNLLAAQVHAGQGLVEPLKEGEPWTWNGAGALTPIQRYGEMLSGWGLFNADGEEWYFPERLTIDTGAVAEGNANAAQEVLGEHASHGHDLPASLHILAINSELDKVFAPGGGTLKAAEILAEQSNIPSGNLTLIDVENTYSHNDPAGAYPTNEFVTHLVPFLEGL
jgi:pimeloyl-ACP methyl ester carboxylesterase